MPVKSVFEVCVRDFGDQTSKSKGGRSTDATISLVGWFIQKTSFGRHMPKQDSTAFGWATFQTEGQTQFSRTRGFKKEVS